MDSSRWIEELECACMGMVLELKALGSGYPDELRKINPALDELMGRFESKGGSDVEDR